MFDDLPPHSGLTNHANKIKLGEAANYPSVRCVTLILQKARKPMHIKQYICTEDHKLGSRSTQEHIHWLCRYHYHRISPPSPCFVEGSFAAPFIWIVEAFHPKRHRGERINPWLQRGSLWWSLHGSSHVWAWKGKTNVRNSIRHEGLLSRREEVGLFGQRQASRRSIEENGTNNAGIITNDCGPATPPTHQLLVCIRSTMGSSRRSLGLPRPTIPYVPYYCV
jgi:hypothetical protein